MVALRQTRLDGPRRARLPRTAWFQGTRHGVPGLAGSSPEALAGEASGGRKGRTPRYLLSPTSSPQVKASLRSEVVATLIVKKGGDDERADSSREAKAAWERTLAPRYGIQLGTCSARCTCATKSTNERGP